MAKYFVLLCAAILMHGCGGGGSDSSTPPATQAVVRLSTQGALPQGAGVAGVGVTLNVPAGTTVAVDPGGGAASGVVSGSGETASNAVVSLSEVTPPTASTAGTVRFVLASTAPAGFGVGEFATVNCGILPGATPATTGFSVAEFRAVDLAGGTITTVTPALNVQLQ